MAITRDPSDASRNHFTHARPWRFVGYVHITRPVSHRCNLKRGYSTQNSEPMSRNETDMPALTENVPISPHPNEVGTAAN